MAEPVQETRTPMQRLAAAARARDAAEEEFERAKLGVEIDTLRAMSEPEADVPSSRRRFRLRPETAGA